MKKLKKRLNLSCLLISTLILSSCSDKNTELSEHTINARNKLKIYGLSNCVSKQFKDDVNSSADIVFSELLITSSLYHQTGIGMHVIKKNVDTFEVIYDPYKETKDYFSETYRYMKKITSMKTGKPVVFLNCFGIYNSKEFDDFIKEQDIYIQNINGG